MKTFVLRETLKWLAFPLLLITCGCVNLLDERSLTSFFVPTELYQNYNGPPKPLSEIACLIVPQSISIEGPKFRPSVGWPKYFKRYPIAALTHGEGFPERAPTPISANRCMLEMLPSTNVLKVSYSDWRLNGEGTWSVKPVEVACHLTAGHIYAVRYKMFAEPEGSRNLRIRYWLDDVSNDPDFSKKPEIMRKRAMKDPDSRYFVPFAWER
jgi:hypothetical protein